MKLRKILKSKMITLNKLQNKINQFKKRAKKSRAFKFVFKQDYKDYYSQTDTKLFKLQSLLNVLFNIRGVSKAFRFKTYKRKNHVRY